MIIYIMLMVGCAKNTQSVSESPLIEAFASSTEPVSSGISPNELANLFVQAINDNNPDLFLSHVMSVEAFYSVEDCTGLSEERQREEAKKKEEFGFVFQMMKMGISNSIQQIHQEGYSATMLGVEVLSKTTKKKGEIQDEECSLVKDVELIQMDVRINKSKETENIEEVYNMRLMNIDGTVYVGQVVFPQSE